MSLSIDIASSATEELLNGLNNLVPQLSSSAAPLTIGDVEALIANPAVSVFVAKNDGAIVGTLTLVVFPIPSGLRAWIEDVVVDEGARGLGAGAALTEAAVAESKKRGARSIDLTSRPSREVANAMYVKLGFEQRETNVYRLSLK
jgi:ribosomal protein S18 acetylase RimI-like enzyme